MTVDQHLTEFAGLPVRQFEASGAGGLPDAASVAWRVAFDGTTRWHDALLALLDSVDAERITALVVGWWGHDGEDRYPADVLVEVADRLPGLRALFFADVVVEENEISWIQHSDITPLLAAFPQLERFEVRGGDGLTLEPLASTSLRALRFESGGLPGEIVQAVVASDLPNLAHLDFWFGEENYNYGREFRVEDLAPLLSGERFPALRHLGLEDSELQDEIAAAVAGAPVVAQLESLSLAMGTLTDEGAEALLSGQPLTHLKRLDLHHHFLTDEMMRRVRDALPGTEVDLDEQQERDEDWLFVAVSE
ncbi:STM4015 family protein [Actinomadura gamaensis]|uniref:STM4015 family protein n=1 Tax=Actinomadura gamaensis TaxID=1763541 RepID=A0ABV9U9X3_9ACTN